jgi:type IV pilus assembly protein PilA
MYRKGFSLIELMIVIAIIAILAAIAISAYSDYTIRAKFTEGYSMAMTVRNAVGTAYTSNGMHGVARRAADFPPGNNATASKFVQYVTVDGSSGVISVVFAATAGNGVPTALNGSTMTLTPQIRDAGGYQPLADGLVGTLDWACASDGHSTAQARGMLYTAGTVPAKYMPSECR